MKIQIFNSDCDVPKTDPNPDSDPPLPSPAPKKKEPPPLPLKSGLAHLTSTSKRMVKVCDDSSTAAPKFQSRHLGGRPATLPEARLCSEGPRQGRPPTETLKVSMARLGSSSAGASHFRETLPTPQEFAKLSPPLFWDLLLASSMRRNKTGGEPRKEEEGSSKVGDTNRLSFVCNFLASTSQVTSTPVLPKQDDEQSSRGMIGVFSKAEASLGLIAGGPKHSWRHLGDPTRGIHLGGL